MGPLGFTRVPFIAVRLPFQDGIPTTDYHYMRDTACGKYGTFRVLAGQSVITSVSLVGMPSGPVIPPISRRTEISNA